MIKLQLINADIIYDTAIVTSQEYIIRRWIRPFSSFCLLHIEEFWKMAIPLFGATGNFNHHILTYDILFLTSINTNIFYLLSFKFHANLLRFPLSWNKHIDNITNKGNDICDFLRRNIILKLTEGRTSLEEEEEIRSFKT